jgi:hypothetical protein
MYGNEQCSQDRQGSQRRSPTAQSKILLRHFSYNEPQGYGDESYAYRGPVIPESENVEYRLNHCGLKYCNKPRSQKKKRCAQHFLSRVTMRVGSSRSASPEGKAPFAADFSRMYPIRGLASGRQQENQAAKYKR